SPLFSPVHPTCFPVGTGWPASSRDSGRGKDSSSRMRTGCQQILGYLEGRDSLLAGHGGKIVKKLLEGVSGGKVVEKIFNRNASTDQHGSATGNIRVASDNRFESEHASLRLTREP